MHVAVTGASGFVGRAVVAQLLARGVSVTAVSRRALSSSAHPQLIPCRLDLAQLPPDPFAALGRPDVLVHLAWDGLPNYAAARHVDEELPRQLDFLTRCAQAGLQRLLVSGTCLEYGMQQGCLAESLPTAPVVAYAQAKDRLRLQLQSLVQRLPLQLCWLRLFYLYGEGQAATSLYAQLRAAVQRGDARFPLSPGDQLRDFQPIDSAAAQIAALTVATPSAPIVNICSGRPLSVVDFVRERLAQWGAQIELDRGVYPYPAYEPHAFWGDRRQLDHLLGTA